MDNYRGDRLMGIIFLIGLMLAAFSVVTSFLINWNRTPTYSEIIVSAVGLMGGVLGIFIG